MRYYLQLSGQANWCIFDEVDEYLYRNWQKVVKRSENSVQSKYTGLGFCTDNNGIQIQGTMNSREMAVIHRICGGKPEDCPFRGPEGGFVRTPEYVILAGKTGKHKPYLLLEKLTRQAA